jgi:hypothetical protein
MVACTTGLALHLAMHERAANRWLLDAHFHREQPSLGFLPPVALILLREDGTLAQRAHGA